MHTDARLDWLPATEHPDLLADPVRAAVDGTGARVARIDPALADTAAFCAEYGIALDASANCVIVHGKRAGESTYAAVLVLATARADVNGVVRRHLGVRKISFAAQDDAVARTDMEYGGITPFGLPAPWPILVDRAVADTERVVVGSGIRGSKLLVAGAELAGLPGATVLDLAVARVD